MVAAQNRVQTLLGIDNSTKGKKVETTIHHTKQPQLSVRGSMIESLNEEIEIKLSSLSPASTSGSCDGYTEMTSLQRSIECSDVSYKEHWWQI